MGLYPDLLKHKERCAAIADTGMAITYNELSTFSLRMAVAVKPHSWSFPFAKTQ